MYIYIARAESQDLNIFKIGMTTRILVNEIQKRPKG